MLAQKDDVQYGARFGRLLDAKQMLLHAKSFADWAESELTRRFPAQMTWASAEDSGDEGTA